MTELRLVLLLICVAGTALAGGLSRLAARRVLAPLAEVAATAQSVSETEDLSQRIIIRSDDEVGELASRFNTMLDRLQTSRVALGRSVTAQRQLVADASHELRTPVTSLRANAELLLQNPDIDRVDRDELLTDVVEQTEELTALIAGLIELARETPQDEHFELLRVDEMVDHALVRARRNRPTVAFDAQLEPFIAYAIPERGPAEPQYQSSWPIFARLLDHKCATVEHRPMQLAVAPKPNGQRAAPSQTRTRYDLAAAIIQAGHPTSLGTTTSAIFFQVK